MDLRETLILVESVSKKYLTDKPFIVGGLPRDIYLKNLIDVLPTIPSLPNDKTIISKTLTEKIKILSDYVVLIRIK